MAKQLNVDLRFTADNGQAKKQIQELQSSLEKLMTSANKGTSGLGITKDIAQATNEVAKLQAMLESSKNSSGGLDLGKFNQSLSKGKMQISDYAKVLSSLGPEGEQAFAKMAKAIINAEVPLKRTNSVLKEFKTSLANTARWQLSSSMLHGFMGAVQSAYGYAQDLNESLNNIRIVTGQNIEQMSRFAQEANKAAQALSTTTTDYTNASLIFYQQGLSDAEVSKRTEVTIKMANAAGQSAQIVSDQLTAVWNNFYDGSKSLEYYADVMTALGAATASSTDEIAGGLEKFAAIGQTIGLSYEYAASALATITSNTRQSEEVVGTALKTIFARIQGLNLGDTLDDGTTLNKYSQALQKVGISIFEQNGEIKKMDNILDEMAAKWDTLAKDQQIALAQTVAGVRQYNQLISLMDNWNAGDSDSMVANLNTSYNASGTLTEQADIYAESWEAAQKRVTAAAEEIYNELLNDKFFIELNNGFAGFLNIISDTIGALGGLPGVLSVASTIMFKMFGKDMAKAIDDWAYNIRLRSQDGVDAIIESRQKAKKALQDTFTDSVDTGPTSAATKASFESSVVVADALLKKREEMVAKGQALSAEDELQIQYLQKANDALGEQATEAGRLLEQTKQHTKELEAQARLKISRAAGKSDAEKTELKETLAQIKENQQAYAALDQVANKINDDFTVDNIISELEFLSEATASAGGNTDHLQALIAKLGKEGTSVDEAIKAIADEVERLGNEAYDAMDGTEGIRGSLKELGMTDDAIDKLINSWTKQGIITADLAQKLRGVKVQGDAAAEAIAKMKSPPPSLGQAFVTIAQSIGNVASAINTLKGLIDTWNNDDMSFGDKLLSTFTSLGMVIPMLINGYKTLSTARLKDTLINELNAASERRLAKAKRETARSSDQAEREQREETAAQQQDIITDAAQSRNSRFTDQTATSMTGSDGVALTKGGASIGASLLAIAAAIAIVVGTVAWAVHQSKAAERELEKAKQAASELKQNYETVKAAQEEFNNTASSYESARDALDNLTQGTEEYTQAVQAANEQAMALLEINKDLAYTIEGGQIKIDETSLENAKKAQQQQLEYAQAAQIAGQQQAKQADENLKKRDMARQLNTNADNGLALGNTAAAGLAGAAAGALIGSAIPVIGTAIGAAVGGAIGLIGGFISDAVKGTAVEAETDALEKLEKAYAEDNTILQKLADGSLTDQEWDAIGIEDENLRASLQANSDEVSALVKEMAANTAAISAQNDLVAANALADNEAVQKSDYQDQIIDIAGDAYGVAYDKAMKSDWVDTWGKEGINKATGVNQKAEDVFAEYLKYAGLEGQGYTLTDTTGTDKNRKFVYEDAEGNEHTVSLEAMQAARAAYEASNVLNDSATKLAATFDKLANSGNNADQALLSFVSGKNFEGATKSEFEAMQNAVGEVAYDEATGRYDTAGIQAYVEGALGETLTDEVATRYGYETADAMLQAYAKRLANADEAWNSIKVPDNFKFADDLSLGAAKALETQISKINLGPAGEAAGKQYVEKLNEMLGELDPEDQQAALEALTKIDWSDWDAMDQAKQIMSDLGVEIDFGSEAWQRFAQEMRIAGGAIPDFSGLKQDLIDITSILGKLDFGGTISDADYQTLMASEYGKEWEQFFILQADGTRKFIGNSQQMLSATRDQINAERQALAERKKIQEDFNKVKWQYTDANGNKVDVDWAKAAEDGIQDGDVATARNLMNSGGATQSALEELGYDDATLLKIIEAAEAGDENARAQIAEMFNRLQAFRDEDLAAVDVDLNEMMASTATSIHELNAMLEEGEISTEAWAKQAVVLEEAAGKNANTLAELDQVVADFGLNKLDETYTQNLLRIAEGYESCAEEASNYQMALTALTLDKTNKDLEEQVAIAEDNLRAMVRLEEGAAQYGLEVKSLTAQSKRLAKEYGLSAEEAANLAIKNQRMNKGVSSLVDNWKDWKKQLTASNKLTQDYADALVDCTAAIADLVGASEDLELPDEFFNADNMALIEKAMQGDVNAVNQLGAAVAATTVEALTFNEAFATVIASMETFRNEPIDLDLLDEEQFLADQQLVLQGIEDIKNGVIGADQAMSDDWVAALNRMALATGMSVEQMNGLLGSLGVQAKVDVTYVKQPMKIPTYTDQITAVNYRRLPLQTIDPYTGKIITGETMVPEYTKASVPGEPVEVEGFAAVAQISTVDNPLTPEITTSTAGGGGGSGGGSSKPAATYSPNRGPVAPSATKGSNSGGGGGSKEKEASKAETIDKTKKNEVVERYKEVNDALDDLSDEYEKASRSADRLWGEHRLDALRKQNALIAEQQELLAEKQKQAQQYMRQDQVALQQAAAAVGLAFSFDENGNITNYTDQMSVLYEQLSAAEDYYNSLSTGEDQDAYEETILEPLRDKITAVEDAMSLYEESRELFEELGLEIDDLQDQIMQNNYDIIMEGLELHISFNEEDLENIEYYLSKIEDDFYKMHEAAALMIGPQLNEYKDNLKEYAEAMNELNRAYAAGEITEAMYQEGLEEVRAGIRDNLSSIVELDKTMMNYYGETIAMAQEELGKYTAQLEHHVAVLEHYRNMMNLLGKETDFDALGIILEGQAKTAENALKVSKENYEMYKRQVEAIEQQIAEATTDEAKALLQKEWEAANTAMQEAQQDMLNKTEAWVESLRAILENKLSGFAQDLENALTGGTSFDTLTTSMERAASLQEEYLTTTNQIYETNKLMRTAQQAIDNSTSSIAKNRLKQFINETKQLQDQNKLSEYELEIQQAKYNLLLAEMALEDARDAKTVVRLKRDSEGNLGYVYTADQDKLAEAQQQLEDAQNSLYNIGLEGANEYSEKYQQTMSEMYDTFTALQEQYLSGEFETEAEYQEAMLKAKEYYYEKLKNYSSLHQVAITTDSRVIADAWSSDYSEMIFNTEDWMRAVTEYVGNVNLAFDEWEANVETITNQTLGPNLDTLEDNVKDITDANDALTDSIVGDGGVIDAIESELDQVSELTGKYANLRQQIQGLIADHETLMVRIGNEPNPYTPPGTGTSGSSSSSGSGSGNGSGSSNSGGSSSGSGQGSSTASTSSGTSTSEANAPDYSDTTKQGVALAIWNGGFGWGNGTTRRNRLDEKGFDPDEIQRIVDATNPNGNWRDRYGISDLNKYSYSSFDTGGYTGTWGSYGKFAMLHEKELVLNPGETENFLASMEVLRSIIKMIDLQSTASQLGGLLHSPGYLATNASDTLEQNVHIEASFPEVHDRYEIEAALTSIVNRASQFANRK